MWWPRTSGGYSVREPNQIATWNPNRDCWETGAVDIFGHSDVYSETWPTSGMTRNGVAYALPTWAPPTSGSGCSSSPPEQMFRTPCAAEAAGGPRNPDRPGATMRLSDQVREEAERGVLLPTPVAQPSGNTPEDHLRKKPGRDVVTDLAIIAENGLLPTGGRMLPPSIGGSNYEDQPLPLPN